MKKLYLTAQGSRSTHLNLQRARVPWLANQRCEHAPPQVVQSLSLLLLPLLHTCTAAAMVFRWWQASNLLGLLPPYAVAR